MICSRNRLIHATILLVTSISPLIAGQSSTRSSDEKRIQLARNFTIYDFEPRGNDLDSRDIDGDGWPDYWQTPKGEGISAYLQKHIRIVEDTTGDRPGLWKDTPGHVLHMRYDGTRVAVQTKTPRDIDPDLAYEITAWSRDKRLTASKLRIWVIWLHIDKAKGEEELDRSLMPNVPTGQIQWAEEPWVLRVNDLHPDTNAARIFVEIVDDPDRPGADRHGEAWVDDIRIVKRPKIKIKPVMKEVDGSDTPESGIIRFDINYLGLIDNIPIPGRFRGKEYRRTIDITNMYGRPPSYRKEMPTLELNRKIDPGPGRTDDESITLNMDRYGIYYVTVRLFGHRDRLLAEVTQVVGLLPANKSKGNFRRQMGEYSGTYGILLGAPEKTILLSKGVLHEHVMRLGVSNIKVHAWPADFSPQKESQSYLDMLNRELRFIRSTGVRITAVIPDTPSALQPKGMRETMKEKPELLKAHLVTSVNMIAPHIDTWQWGMDDDNSFSEDADTERIAAAQKNLVSMVGSVPQAFPIDISGSKTVLPAPKEMPVLSVFVPSEMDLAVLPKTLARFFPSNFDQLRRDYIYPPPHLARLGIKPPSYQLDPPELRKQDAWISLSLPMMTRQLRHALEERKHLEAMAQRAILANALGFKRIYTGSLFDPDRGLTYITRQGDAVPRPAFLAIRILERYLGGSAYLGSFQFRDHFTNFVFRRRNSDEVVIAIWYNGEGESKWLSRNEVAVGMDLTQVDMAGNRFPLPDKILVRKTPTLILGMSAPLAQTRMSIKISPAPPLRSRHSLQPQLLAVTNFFKQQLPAEFRFKYAAKGGGDFRRELGWTLRPEKITMNLPPARNEEYPSATGRYEVQPDPNSEIHLAGPNHEDASGEKFVRIVTSLNTTQPVKVHLLRKTRLTSELVVKVESLKRQQSNDDNRIHLQLFVKWFPTDPANTQTALTLTPYYVKAGQLREKLPAKLVVPALQPQDISRTDIAAEAIEVVIPRGLQQTWIGLDEEGGTRFYRIDVTRFVRSQ